jgi:hypothetical protein
MLNHSGSPDLRQANNTCLVIGPLPILTATAFTPDVHRNKEKETLLV